MIKDILKGSADKMNKAVDHVRHEFMKIRTKQSHDKSA